MSEKRQLTTGSQLSLCGIVFGLIIIVFLSPIVGFTKRLAGFFGMDEMWSSEHGEEDAPRHRAKYPAIMAHALVAALLFWAFLQLEFETEA